MLFAQDCMSKLDQIVERLATTLGDGTDDLSLRTGMHSGEVTAGVLRGEKGRFLLFGGEWIGGEYSDRNGLAYWKLMAFSLAPWIFRDGQYRFEDGKHRYSAKDPGITINSRRIDHERKAKLVGAKEGERVR